jgi:hypothetical protein
MAQAQAGAIPFAAAALPYREKIWTTTWTPSTVAQDVSPPNQIKSYGYLRALVLKVTTKTAASSGGTLAADAPWNAFSQISVTQPNGEELFGGPTWSGYHTYIAAKHSGRNLNNDPKTWPSYSASATAPTFNLPIVFEINSQLGIGALPNQDASAPWKVQLTANTLANLYTTAPTTTNPTLQLDLFMECWSVPAPFNPLNPRIAQEVAPPLLGTLNKWTVQQYTVTASSAYNLLLSRKGNSIRNLAFIGKQSGQRTTTATAFPNPLSIRWDGTVVRANDDPVLWVDDEYKTRGGDAAATPVTADAAVIVLQMSDPAGIDCSGVAFPPGMNKQWGTVQSSTIEMDGTWGASLDTVEVLTNDVQFVNLSGNPYAFAYPGVYLQAPAQPSARP